ncbi:hypothetical protein P5673_017177 [Acropora cervicornis]|uniref:Uncharacterized protein n=1 Tax=Acropora cervicornis TaxID=6130 RepID=A0AAD9QF91_ACRCE|nr:hypothetical protein P5673_017177 [Acropora cervicornis]
MRYELPLFFVVVKTNVNYKSRFLKPEMSPNVLMRFCNARRDFAFFHKRISCKQVVAGDAAYFLLLEINEPAFRKTDIKGAKKEKSRFLKLDFPRKSQACTKLYFKHKYFAIQQEIGYCEKSSLQQMI